MSKYRSTFSDFYRDEFCSHRAKVIFVRETFDLTSYDYSYFLLYVSEIHYIKIIFKRRDMKEF